MLFLMTPWLNILIVKQMPNLGLCLKALLMFEIIYVQSVASIATYRPIFRQELHDVKVNQNQVVRLEVRVDAHPAPQIIWLHNQQPIDQTNPNVKVPITTGVRKYFKISLQCGILYDILYNMKQMIPYLNTYLNMRRKLILFVI